MRVSAIGLGYIMTIIGTYLSQDEVSNIEEKVCL